MRTFRNPVIPGFYPDPSICRVAGDYYLVTSSFHYFPGLPVFHSRDLVNWRQLGHVLDRPSQLDLDGVGASCGLYAPTIRHHQGTFYVINTLVPHGRKPAGGNFIVTATNPAGPWSQPHWLPDAPGIDPSLFFDEDGRAWYTGNRDAGGYDGHREIWLQELDLTTMKLVGERHGIWDGALQRNTWCEAPHLYKVGGMYYLVVAEGGTGHDHAVTVARSDRVAGPYRGNPRNPILTHRHLCLGHPIVGTGHADIVETTRGQWWLVCLAMRPYGGYHYNLGRETFLAPLVWEDGWPVACPGAGRIESEQEAPSLVEHPWPARAACDNFDGRTLGPDWNFIRTPRGDFWSLAERPGRLRLRLKPERLSERANPAFVGRRQRHIDFAASAAMEFVPQGEGECAGLAALQNEDFHYVLAITRSASGTVVARVTRRAKGRESVVAEKPAPEGRVSLKVEARGQDYGFYVAAEPQVWTPVAEHLDGRILSTPVAGGFVGTYVGMYASANGRRSETAADFDWFEYAGFDEGR